jgi:hypothetical protein
MMDMLPEAETETVSFSQDWYEWTTPIAATYSEEEGVCNFKCIDGTYYSGARKSCIYCPYRQTYDPTQGKCVPK